MAFYLFSFWYGKYLWRCFVLLLEEIQFISWGFSFLATSTFSHVSGGCNQPSSTLFFVVFKSLSWCVNAIFNAGKSSSSFFSCHILLLLLRFFHTKVNWWLFNPGIWVTASILWSSRLFSVFWPVLRML